VSRDPWACRGATQAALISGDRRVDVIGGDQLELGPYLAQRCPHLLNEVA
jgi:hypothetical protein